MSRMPRESFALMLALLPATAIGLLVLGPVSGMRDIAGVLLPHHSNSGPTGTIPVGLMVLWLS